MKLKSILYEEDNPLTMVSKGPAQQPGSSSVISDEAPESVRQWITARAAK